MASYDVRADTGPDAILIEEKDVQTVALMAAKIWGFAADKITHEIAANAAVDLFAETAFAVIKHNRGRLVDTAEDPPGSGYYNPVPGRW